MDMNKPIRLIETFAGYGSQLMSLKMLGADVNSHCISEWDVNANASYNAIHSKDKTNYAISKSTEELIDELYNLGISTDGKTLMTKDKIKRKGEKWIRQTYNAFKQNNNLGSVCNIHGRDLKIENTDEYLYCMTYSFPCFTGDTLVLTTNGYKPIKDIQTGDKVLTHTNQYQTVLDMKETGINSIYKIEGMGIAEIQCTRNHRFYVRKKYRKYIRDENQKRISLRLFKDAEWIECEKLTKDYYMGIAINQNEIIPSWDGIDLEWSDGRSTRHKNQLGILMDNEDFWWLIGRYVGDGWHRTQGGIIICSNHTKTKEITDIVSKLNLNFCVSKERTVDKIHIPLKELELFVEPFGCGAKNKKIPGFMFDMPKNLLKAFIWGYFSADGYKKERDIYSISSVSKELIYGTAQLIAKAFEVPYSIYQEKHRPTTIIEGRTVNQSICYSINWKLDKRKQDKAFYENGYIWFPINKITSTNKEEVTYDLTVENDHSFTANGVIAHNCTDLSLAGKRAGMEKGSGTASSLLWEIERILQELHDEKLELPQILLMENVPQVISDKNIDNFNTWCAFLEGLGYENHYKVLNGKDFGIAQNRKRCFMFSFLGENKYEFPKTIPLNVRLRDFLEDKVDESYYINSEKAKILLEDLLARGILDNYIDKRVVDGSINLPQEKKVANALTAKDRSISNRRSEQNCVVETYTNPRVIGQMEGTFESTNRVYDINGVCPTLNTCGGGDRQPKIIIDDTQGFETEARAYQDMVPSLRASRSGLKVLEPEISVLGNYMESGHEASRVVDINGVAPTVKENHGTITGIVEPIICDDCNDKIKTDQTTVRTIMPNFYNNTLGNGTKLIEPMIVAMRGRNPENPSDRTVGAPTEQRLEPNIQGISNTLTSVTKDNLVLETVYRIRKLTERECGRLMGVPDDIITKMMTVNSKSALYKQFGNSIMTNCLMALFSQLGLKGVKKWNDIH